MYRANIEEIFHTGKSDFYKATVFLNLERILRSLLKARGKSFSLSRS